MTPGLVPGLAANKITGVRDRFWPGSSFEGSLACGELPRNMENPIQFGTPSPVRVRRRKFAALLIPPVPLQAE
jgi:hypothetical protein